MHSPTFHHTDGDIFDDAGKLITLDEAADLAVTFAQTTEAATNTAVRYEMARAAASVCQAIRECLRHRRSNIIRPDWSNTAKLGRNLSRSVASLGEPETAA